MSLNRSQAEAVRHINGPMLVLAGPGSGKTSVITERTKQLIASQGIDPSHILVITFTKAAASEMKERFFRLMGGKNYPVTFGTFHAVFFHILKHAYGFHGGNIIREEQRFQFMKEIIQKMHLEYQDENEFAGDLLGEISLMKNTGISLEHYYSKNCGKEIFEQIYRNYDSRMKQSRLIDFDDMLVYCYELFDQRKDILSAWQRKYQYILIDEFQDINRLQFDIVKMLALPENNLFVVGDDDQSIYRFRGAKPELMLGFEEAYPKAGRVLLDINYRSCPAVVESSLRLISHNAERFDKKIQPGICQAGQDNRQGVKYFLWENQKEEGKAIIEQILKDCREGDSYNDCAVLFRTNTQPRLFMSQLMAYNIPFRTRDNIPNLYEHWITRDILTYIRLAQGSRARKDFLQIMNRPNRYITRESLEEDTIALDVWAEYFYDKKQHWVAERIEQLEGDLRVLSRTGPFAAINYIRMGIGYEEFLKTYAQYRRISEDNLLEVLEELQDGAKEFCTYEEWFAHMEEYTKELQRQKKQQEMLSECVSLATLHSAKGLEYKRVHIIDVNEELMPYKKAVLDADLQEERRMFYVGVTRAKENLYIHSVKKYNGREVDVSRFVEEMQAQAAE
ncbi:ATP-dependent helicase [Petralouisia muris]|uniref:ATP-dependent helicase n=1 Tax=Petralouisia muris TaxID=3032872 RepID=A0AC61RY47_9FIRM|nr:ATP-dependent helicase [Petralouisia muris]TGY96871.1 ATP-dependent helicase [Petralouisia muris]